MPKTIELTVEIIIQKVTCPGVWLCQDGGVSLIVFALGTSYETCMLPPTFPLMFNDKLYFRKRFQETCALNNICCLLKNETLYCELVQFSQSCASNECNILAQYLGSLTEVLFPPKMCCSDGVDLLMRRSKKYPGILSPKIEIATKVRIDEVWSDTIKPNPYLRNIRTCHCSPRADPRQKAVCHSADYHRNKCLTGKKQCGNSGSRTRSRGSGSCISLKESIPDKFRSAYSDRPCKSALSRTCRRDYCVYNVEIPKEDRSWISATGNSSHESDDGDDIGRDKEPNWADRKRDKKIVLESHYVDDDRHEPYKEENPSHNHKVELDEKSLPCVCEICKRYHELFHSDSM